MPAWRSHTSASSPRRARFDPRHEINTTPYTAWSGPARREARNTHAQRQPPDVTLTIAARHGAHEVNTACISRNWSTVTALMVRLFIVHNVLTDRDDYRSAGVQYRDFDEFKDARMARFNAVYAWTLAWIPIHPDPAGQEESLKLCLMALQYTHTEVFDWPENQCVPYDPKMLGEYVAVCWWQR